MSSRGRQGFEEFGKVTGLMDGAEVGPAWKIEL